MSQQEQVEAKVRKLFKGRTHKAPKIEVEVVPALRKYKTIIAPYEPTVEAITALIQEAREQTAESFHRRIFDEFDMLPRIQDAYKGDRNIDVRKLQKLMCDFERDVEQLNSGDK